jgi:hypothetical protein
VESVLNLPTGAVIKIHRGHATPVDDTETAAAIVQAVDGLGVVVPVLVLVLIPRAGRYIGR